MKRDRGVEKRGVGSQTLGELLPVTGSQHELMSVVYFLVTCPIMAPPMKDAAGTATPRTPTANV